MLNLEDPNAGDLDYGQSYSADPSSGLVGNTTTQSAMEAELGSFFSGNYEDIDEFLTQELKDLDIPMIPQKLGNNADAETFLPYDTVWNRADETSETPQKTHKRGPSGTAIFGFANHNKQLSLSKINTEDPLPGNASAPQLLDYTSARVDKQYDAQSSNLNSLILKQQEELRLALERQQQMNEQLEEQLRCSQLQQKQLQMALQEQAMATQHLSGSISPDEPHSARSSQKKKKSIIVTSNSANGGYKFPPPQDMSKHNGVISPVSGTSMNGSPNRKTYRGVPPVVDIEIPPPDNMEGFSNSNDYINHDNFTKRVPNDTVQKMSQYFEKINSQIPASNNKLKPKLNSTHPLTPQQQILIGAGSSSSSPRGPCHKSKESISSSASTIPQLYDDDNNESNPGAANCTIGLGIQLRDDRSKPKYTLNKPPPLDLLPTIPGSRDNTPVNKNLLVNNGPGAFPQKHIFQHTPIKNTLANPHRLSNSNADGGSNNIFNTLKEKLKPPTSYDSDDDLDRPESEFTHAKTPSPILRSQGRFEGSSPSLEHHYPSPLKITKKPTTLPPGEIDKFVKELPDKTFECLHPDCGKTFRRRYNIRSHIQTHLEDRPYFCDFEGCHKAFVRNHDLIRHKKTHAEKCYVCPCGKKFVREDALLVHRSRMICVGAKKYSNVVIKKSPRRRGRPRKDGTFSVNSSPVKDSIHRDNNGTIALQMEEQLKKELIQNGLLDPSCSMTNMHSPLE